MAMVRIRDYVDIDPDEFFDKCDQKERAELYDICLQWIERLSDLEREELGIDLLISLSATTLLERAALDALKRKWARLNPAELLNYLDSI